MPGLQANLNHPHKVAEAPYIQFLNDILRCVLIREQCCHYYDYDGTFEADGGGGWYFFRAEIEYSTASPASTGERVKTSWAPVELSGYAQDFCRDLQDGAGAFEQG